MPSSQEFRAPNDRTIVTRTGNLQSRGIVDVLDSAHDAKAKILNDALHEIDMGTFQVRSSAPLTVIIYM